MRFCRLFANTGRTAPEEQDIKVTTKDNPDMKQEVKEAPSTRQRKPKKPDVTQTIPDKPEFGNPENMVLIGNEWIKIKPTEKNMTGR